MAYTVKTLEVELPDDTYDFNEWPSKIVAFHSFESAGYDSRTVNYVPLETREAAKEAMSYGDYGHMECGMCHAPIEPSHRYCHSCGAMFTKTRYKEYEGGRKGNGRSH